MHRSIDFAETIVEACLAHDLRGRAFYAIAPEEGTPIHPGFLGAAGGRYLHRHRLDLAMQPWLESAGRWRGEGVAIIADIPSTVIDPYVVGMLLHEAAHWLDAPEVIAEHDDHATAIQRDILPVSADHFAPLPSQIPPAIWAHYDRFQRACVHLWGRCNQVCPFKVLADALSFGSTYKSLELLSNPYDYIALCREEIVSLYDLPIRQILDTPPPPAFAALWEADLDRMWNSALVARAQAAA